jgi:hypothetical protein
MVFGTNSLNINANVIRDANPNVRVLTNEVDQLVDYGQAGGSAQFPCQIPACRSSGYWAIDPATVSAVPLPDSLLLFTVGLAVIVPVSLRGKPLRGS